MNTTAMAARQTKKASRRNSATKLLLFIMT